jgi:nitroreductase
MTEFIYYINDSFEEVAMDLKELILRTRSCRRFDAGVPIGEEPLRRLIELARATPSAANRQPLKYVLSCSADQNRKIFETLSWAAYLKDWKGPDDTERPTAYIVVTLDKSIAFDADIDVGIVSQTILLGATEMGFGGCILANFKKIELEELLGLPQNLIAMLVIALGKPAESVVLEDLPGGGSVKYYRDEASTHHVPKRTVDELIFTVFS